MKVINKIYYTGLVNKDATGPTGRPKAPAKKSVRGKVAEILCVLTVPVALSFGLSSGEDDRDKRDAEVLSLMANYSADGASIYDGSWTGNDGSVAGRYTLHITNDGTEHVCRQVSVDSLRAQESIKCDGGKVIHPKAAPAS